MKVALEENKKALNLHRLQTCVPKLTKHNRMLSRPTLSQFKLTLNCKVTCFVRMADVKWDSMDSQCHQLNKTKTTHKLIQPPQ